MSVAKQHNPGHQYRLFTMPVVDLRVILDPRIYIRFHLPEVK